MPTMGSNSMFIHRFFSDRLQEQGAAIITDQVLPAYRRLKSFINQVRKNCLTFFKKFNNVHHDRKNDNVNCFDQFMLVGISSQYKKTHRHS